MRFHAESSRQSYDAIVVGAGVGGLTLASLLARAGLETLVVERHDRVGGYAHAFRRGRYLFDSAVHLVGGCDPVPYEGGGLLHRVLEAVGARERCHFVRVDPCYAAIFPDASFEAPAELDEFVRRHVELFPEERKGVTQFVQECLNIRREVRAAAELEGGVADVQTAKRFPTLMRYRRATLANVLDAHIESSQLKALLATLWPYLGLAPARLSFLYYATMLMSYVADGAYYCRGSFQRFADALAESFTEQRGEILLRSAVRRIVVEDGRASGVVLENGQQISAPRVFSNADARQTVEELVGTEAFPTEYVDRLRSLRPSLSAFVVYLGGRFSQGALPAQHETFLYGDWNHERSYRDTLAGTPSWVSVTVPTHLDPTLAPAGEQLAVLTTLAPSGLGVGSRDEKQAVTERLLDLAAQQFPALRDEATFVEAATPRTMERYTRNSAGAIYGWELTPDQVGPGRPGVRTPIDGLKLVGHWAQPGGGIYGVVTSGVQAARETLGMKTEAELWRLLESAAANGRAT
jgi:prolycopene isomerase